MTLLSICRDAADECGIGRPTLIYTGTDATTRRLLSAANREGKSLAKLNWPALRKEKTFSSTAAEIQASALAADWARFVDKTFWNRSASRPLIGPLSADEWQNLKAHSGSGTTDSFTFRGADILITPTPTAGQTMAYEYYSTYWCQTGSTGKAAWSADADTGILNEELMTLGVIWRFRKASSMAWEPAYAVYESEVKTALGQSAPVGTYDFAGESGGARPGVYVPERSWT